ncbi:FecCD family ABC transporter permease [Rheinheimera baltica]|uniref:Iron ABC transporter permease n=1 Tax=Rheinheimera baltica TaxID=67576 RepID=A0ABT9HUJ3_9GAMM|nr:iron ABC transporter permease [Rheinheimera baltica]MDP5134802.1 iron ABC transporter permease [Rheinheimera baltica]MDP5151142.1 iron ABC transporter permease [Rheinheimera baltica]MDP5191453.1 iron ABC transporter permease [Rheinheimera baltica]
MLKRHYRLAMGLSILLLLASMLISLTLGSVNISLTDVFNVLVGQATQSDLTETIIFQIRLPRLLCAVLVGAGLAISGAILQNASRNPLADPYLFGLMAGAGLGATLVSVVLPPHLISMALGAFVGALFAVLLVFVVCAGQHWRKVEITLLAGVAVSFMLSAISSFVLYFAEPFAANRIMFWLMGSLSRTDWLSVLLLAPIVLLVLLLALALRRQLDALLLSDESARTLGVNTLRLRLVLLLATALLTACIVSQCGGIAFVGLMVPHIVRHFFGVTSVRLLFGSAIIGALFMIWVDNVARTVLPQQEIPLGVITSLVGSIFFLLIMRRQRL